MKGIAMSSPVMMSVRCRGFSAFSLIGLLLVVAIILYMMFGRAGGGKSYMQTVVETKKEGESLAIGIQAQQLAVLIADYRMNHDGKVPSSYQDMGADAASFKDQWGNPLRFRFDAVVPRGARDFLVISNGPDGQPETSDDISQRVALQF